MYGLSVAGLIAIFFIGTRVFGSRRWIPMPGGFQLQVSEFVKIVLILLVARYLTELKKDDLDWRDLLKIAALVGLPMLLVMKQPDLGTSLTYLPILIGRRLSGRVAMEVHCGDRASRWLGAADRRARFCTITSAPG